MKRKHSAIAGLRGLNYRQRASLSRSLRKEGTLPALGLLILKNREAIERDYRKWIRSKRPERLPMSWMKRIPG